MWSVGSSGHSLLSVKGCSWVSLNYYCRSQWWILTNKKLFFNIFRSGSLSFEMSVIFEQCIVGQTTTPTVHSAKKTNKQVPHSYWLFQVDLLMNNMWFRFPAHVLISFDSLLPYLPLLPPRGFRCWWSGTWGPFSLAAVPLCFYILTGLGIDSHLWMNPFFTFDSFTWVNSYIVINKNMSTLYGFQWWCLFLGGGVIPN